jgi:hypothetical protein
MVLEVDDFRTAAWHYKAIDRRELAEFLQNADLDLVFWERIWTSIRNCDEARNECL